MISSKDLSNKLDTSKLLKNIPDEETKKLIVKDYYKYANEKWDKSHTIPKKYSAWTSFHIINEMNRKRIEDIVEKTAKKKGLTHNETLIKNFYLAGMDSKKIEKENMKPLLTYLNMIDGIFSLSDYVEILPFFHILEIVPIFRFYPVIDSKEPSKYTLHFFEGELGLPSRDYYLEKRHSDKTKKYKEYLIKTAKLYNLDCDNEMINEIFKFEKRLAKAYRPPEEKRDVNKNYNLVDVTTMDDKIIKFTEYLDMMANMTCVDLSKHNKIIVGSMNVVKKIRQILKTTDIEISSYI